MRRMRRNHTAEFKAKVALEAIKGIKTNTDIAREFDVHPVMVGQWRKEMLARMPELFGQKHPVVMEKVLNEVKEAKSTTETTGTKPTVFPNLNSNNHTSKNSKVNSKDNLGNQNGNGVKLQEMERKVGQLVMELLTMREKIQVTGINTGINTRTSTSETLPEVPPIQSKTILVRRKEDKNNPEKDIRKTF